MEQKKIFGTVMSCIVERIIPAVDAHLQYKYKVAKSWNFSADVIGLWITVDPDGADKITKIPLD